MWFNPSLPLHSNSSCHCKYSFFWTTLSSLFYFGIQSKRTYIEHLLHPVTEFGRSTNRVQDGQLSVNLNLVNRQHDSRIVFSWLCALYSGQFVLPSDFVAFSLPLWEIRSKFFLFIFIYFVFKFHWICQLTVAYLPFK